MKTQIFLLIFGLLMQFNIFAQNPAVDKIFGEYAGKDGFTTVEVTPDLLGFFFNKDKFKGDFKISSVKILTAEDSAINSKLNFYRDIVPQLGNEYEQLMTVNDKNEKMVILCNKEKNAITEFLMVVGGNENTLIYIKGNIPLSKWKDVSETLSHHDNLNEPDSDRNY